MTCWNHVLALKIQACKNRGRMGAIHQRTPLNIWPRVLNYVALYKLVPWPVPEQKKMHLCAPQKLCH